jgi:predicted DNA-binding transcriptional regulator AlpA
MPAKRPQIPLSSPAQELSAHPERSSSLAFECDIDPYRPTDLLTLEQVEERTKMKRSNIYRLIKLHQFPAPIHLGGAKWIVAEVDEAIERLKEERDRKHGANKFAPRAAILSGSEAAVRSGALSGGKPGIIPSQPPSTVRMLGPEVCEALRMLKVDIPELYLDPAVCNVVLAVIKVELPQAQPAKPGSKGKKR